MEYKIKGMIAGILQESILEFVDDDNILVLVDEIYDSISGFLN